MTYLQSYRNCKTQEELQAEVKTDIFIATGFNPDRISKVVEAAKTVAKERGWTIQTVGTVDIF